MFNSSSQDGLDGGCEIKCFAVSLGVLLDTSWFRDAVVSSFVALFSLYIFS